MNVTGKMKIFKKEFDTGVLYSTTISNKDIDGNYENMYISVQLPRGIDVENGEKIIVNKGFLTFYKTKDGMAKVKLIIQELEKGEEMEEREAIQAESGVVDDSDLPF